MISKLGNEIWKPYNDYYEISNHGNIRSFDRIIFKKDRFHKWQGRPLKKIMTTGYPQVSLGNKIHIKIHQLVAKLFIPNPNNYPAINHIDGNKENNHYTNLEWCSFADNTRHAHKNGLVKNDRGQKASRAILCDNDVIDIKKMVAQGISMKEIHKLYPEVAYTTISNIKNGYAWKHL